MKASKTLLEIRKKIETIKESGVYFLLQDEEVVYVGKCINGIARVHEHFREKKKKFNHYCWVSIPDCTENELSEMEARYIHKYSPMYNGNFGISKAGDNLSISTFCNEYRYKMDSVKLLANMRGLKFKELNTGNRSYSLKDLLSLEDELKKSGATLPPLKIKPKVNTICVDIRESCKCKFDREYILIKDDRYKLCCSCNKIIRRTHKRTQE